MHLTLLLPTVVLVDADAHKIIAEGPAGSFCLLPRHADLVSALVPGLLTYVDGAGVEHFLAIGDGVLVKQAHQVWVSAVRGVESTGMGELHAHFRRQFAEVDARERRARSALARLEAHFARRFIDLQHDG